MPYKYRQVAKKLKALGCEEKSRRGGGSHRKWYNPLTEKGAIIPDHGRDDLGTGILHNAIRQLEIDRQKFESA